MPFYLISAVETSTEIACSSVRRPQRISIMASESSRELDRWQATIAFDSVLAIWIEIREVKAAGLTIDSFSRAVAQLGRAPGSGPGGRGFKSHQPD